MKLFFKKKTKRQQTFSTLIREALEREKAEKKKESRIRREYGLKGPVLEYGV